MLTGINVYLTQPTVRYPKRFASVLEAVGLEGPVSTAREADLTVIIALNRLPFLPTLLGENLG